MENKIVEKVENLIRTKVPDNAQINAFIIADAEYQKLIKEGLATKRGFNIMTTGEIYNPVLDYKYTQS